MLSISPSFYHNERGGETHKHHQRWILKATYAKMSSKFQAKHNFPLKLGKQFEISGWSKLANLPLLPESNWTESDSVRGWAALVSSANPVAKAFQGVHASGNGGILPVHNGLKGGRGPGVLAVQDRIVPLVGVSASGPEETGELSPSHLGPREEDDTLF